MMYTERAASDDRVPRVKVMGTRPSPLIPAVIMIGGLAEENQDQRWEWNLDQPSSKHGPHVAYGLGVQPLLANYTVTMSFDWPAVRGVLKTTRQEAEAVLELAKRHRIAPPYVLVGHSMGGKTALMARTMFNDDVIAAIVVDTAPWSYLNAPDAAPTPEYTAQHPSAAARVRAAMESWRLGHFKLAELATDRCVHCHVDVVPYDAPKEIQQKGRRKIAETERSFCQVTRHFGAGHTIMVTDPRVIVADVLRYVQPHYQRKHFNRRPLHRPRT